jgi:protein-S-isoprenylcysteine O-methyltransferase Ste14
VTTAADVVICAAWLLVIGHNAVLALTGVRQAAELGRWTMGLALAVALVAAGIWLEERSGGRLAAPLAVVVAGTMATGAGALVHLIARARLGRAWSTRPARPPQLVEDGPYAVVRHPLYAGLALVALGTMAAHPSVPTLTGGAGLLAGLTLKIRDEERVLASTFGARWDAYRRRVPRLVPRTASRGR